ncbi:hypothetical protein MVEN_02463800 [Mycena venus]|uniref:Uncharacterized protein n=1 Tax=Mycena venus TaxID=2733690 RepID=A0A8H6WX39_9AGAR|nr:hypothetical protein MVEN_02463800 [Mycena venus]
MAKSTFTPKPALEKLPLALADTPEPVRDKYDENKADLESQISKLLGTSFTLEINPNEVVAYVKEDSRVSIGGMFTSYVNGFISALKSYLDKYGDDGKAHFNAAVSNAQLSINVSVWIVVEIGSSSFVKVNELGDSAPTISADVKEGVYRILFNHDRVGYNMSSQNDWILPAIEAVPTGGFSLQAKNSIESMYNEQIGDLQKEIAEITGIANVVLDPNFEENYKALAALPDTKWHTNFGRVHFSYFEGLKGQLESQGSCEIDRETFRSVQIGFKKDEMLQEGLQEVLESKTFKIRIVNKTTGDKTNETVIEDGVVYLQVGGIPIVST